MNDITVHLLVKGNIMSSCKGSPSKYTAW